MQEAIDTLCTPHQLRILFIHLLTNSCIETPLQLWTSFRSKISEDFILMATGDVEQGCDEALKQLGSLLQGHGKNLRDYGLPQPLAHKNEAEWEIRRWSSQTGMLSQQVDTGLAMFNPEQRAIFAQIQAAVLNNEPLFVMDMVIFRTIFFELLVFFTFTLLIIHFAY